VPINPGQVESDRRHFAAIGVTVPTRPAKPIRILDDGNIGRIADAQQPIPGPTLPGLHPNRQDAHARRRRVLQPPLDQFRGAAVQLIGAPLDVGEHIDDPGQVL